LTPAANEVSEAIKRIALLNAILHGGKAQPKPVLGKLLSERPQLKTKISEVTPLIAEIMEEVNKLSLDQQKKMMQEKWPEALIKEKVEAEKTLPPLPNSEKYEHIVTRFSPNPDCVLHLGSARAVILSHEYAKMYGGLFYLRFEDTDPKLKRPQLPFYKAIREDLLWLGCKWNAEFTQSDRLEIYYEHAGRLLQDGNAYVCTCKPEEFRAKIIAQKPCPCRLLTPEANLSRWEGMLDGKCGEREAVVRLKTDLNHPNPAVRDWPALRIIDTQECPHPRVVSKYRVWPLYNFAAGLDDHLLGITHIIRGKEHLTNQVRQEYMYRHFGWKYPEAIHYGRLKITGATLSKSKILQGIQSGIYKDWDDPRLATFAALRRRGITPEAIKRLIIDVGPNTSDVILSWENLYAHNRKIIDPIANRYFFVKSPINMIIENVPHNFIIRNPLHPDHPEHGFRSFELETKREETRLLVPGDDFDIMKVGAKIRLMGLFNVEIKMVEKNRVEAIFHGESYEEAKKMGAPLIHWVPTRTGIPCEVVMPDASAVKGVAEDACKALVPNQIIQFERFGFVRVDGVGDELAAYFAHR